MQSEIDAIFSLKEPLRCPNPFACLDSEAGIFIPEISSCRDGYTGYLCSSCDTEVAWQTQDSHFCNACPVESELYFWLMTAGAALLIIALLIGISSVFLSTLRGKNQEVVPTLRLLLTTCQILGILNGLQGSKGSITTTSEPVRQFLSW